MNSNTYDYRTSLFAIFCRLYAHSTYKLSTRILVMDYTYKWASHYGERIVSNSQGGRSFSQVAIISLYNFWSFYFFSKAQPCAFTYQKFRNFGMKYFKLVATSYFFGLIVQTALPWTKYFMAFSSSNQQGLLCTYLENI